MDPFRARRPLDNRRSQHAQFSMKRNTSTIRFKVRGEEPAPDRVITTSDVMKEMRYDIIPLPARWLHKSDFIPVQQSLRPQMRLAQRRMWYQTDRGFQCDYDRELSRRKIVKMLISSNLKPSITCAIEALGEAGTKNPQAASVSDNCAPSH